MDAMTHNTMTLSKTDTQDNILTLSIMILRITTLSLITFIIMSLRITTPITMHITALGIRKLNTLTITTLSITITVSMLVSQSIPL
jgi:hypothetical protein